MPEQNDVEALGELYDNLLEECNKYDDELGEFVDGLPTFMEEFGVYDEGGKAGP